MELRPHCLRIGNVLARGCPSPHTTYDNDSSVLKSSNPSHGIGASKNQFHTGIDCSPRNQFRGLMPGVLKSLKKQTLKLGLANIWFGKY
jgi:hypothetical protein